MMKTFPDVGKRADGESFTKEVEKIYNSFKISGYTSEIKDKKILKLSGGDPLDYKPFKLCEKYLKRSFKQKDIYKYQPAAGDEYYRGMIAKYLVKEGFNEGNDITLDNVIVTMSTTHGFKTVLDVIAKEYDVVLMPTPCYGLFVFFPERINVDVRFIKLDKEDNYYINPNKLKAKIQEINIELKAKYKDKNLGYIPKVVAFLNQNPHNPTGIVMGKKQKDLINSISEVCKEQQVYIIDDLVYRDLTFSKDNLAMPMAHNKEFFDNTISLMGLSKCYGYASARAGIVVANENIISLMRDKVFQQMDSIPLPQCAMLAGAFNETSKRYKVYNKYFSKLNSEYEYRYLLLKALIDGINSIENVRILTSKNNKQQVVSKITKDIIKYSKSYNSARKNMNGIKGVEILKGIEMQGGFFALLDFSKIRGKQDRNKNIINTDIELFKYLVDDVGLKLIIGSSIGFDIQDMIMRVTFALNKKELVQYFEIMRESIEKLI